MSQNNRPRIEYAVIGFGAGASQFVADLVLVALMLKMINNSNGQVDYPGRDILVTVFSSATEHEGGGGDAWGPNQDGCINTPIPDHPKMPELPTGVEFPEAYDELLDHILNLKDEVARATIEKFDDLLDRLKKVNQPGASLLLARRTGDSFDTDLACVPRYHFGNLRANALKHIIVFANTFLPYIQIELKFNAWAEVINIDNPKRPQVKVTFAGSNEGAVSTFDKVISFSGTRRKPEVSLDVLDHAYTGKASAEMISAYLSKRECIDGQRCTIGFTGGLLSLIDLATIVGTQREAFELNENEVPSCKAKPLPWRGPRLNKFIVFTRRGVGSIQPRLSFGMDWPGKGMIEESAHSYMNTEQLLALRTQCGYKWMEVVEVIWEAMISYVMKRHPDDYPRYRTMEEEWRAYSEECKKFRLNEHTFCGLQRTLINALFHGYGAEPSVADADQRMKTDYPHIFVSGKRMYNALYAHASSLEHIDKYGSNSRAIDTFKKWYRIYSSSPVEVCEPVFDLCLQGVLKAEIGNATTATMEENKIKVGNQKVDALFAPLLFGQGIDDVIGGILGKLKKQGGSGIPFWGKNGQLKDDKDRFINVWDCGNNRGVGLPYRRNDHGYASTIIPRLSVGTLWGTYEFASSLSACLLAHDLYSYSQGDLDPAQKLSDEIDKKLPPKDEFNAQMEKLYLPYQQVMQRYEYLKAIRAECLAHRWRELFERGLEEGERDKVMMELETSGNGPYRMVAQIYKAGKDSIPPRDAMNREQWYAPFTDIDMSVAWETLRSANEERISLNNGTPISMLRTYFN